jgi:signal recognition particle subunit SEC65
MSLEPSVADRKKFDLDLAYGKVREQQVADMLQEGRIEVKSERGDFSNPRSWVRTGNIAIEFESYGKPSGIAATESDFWFHKLCIDDETFATLVFDVPSLRRIIDNLDYKRVVSGGDNNASRMYLLNIQKLFSTDVIKAYNEQQQQEEEVQGHPV